MLHDKLIREDARIPPDARLEFRVVLGYQVSIGDYFEPGEETLTRDELLRRIAGRERELGGDEQYELIRKEADDHVVLDTAWYADEARFEFAWERDARKRLEGEMEPKVDYGVTLDRYVDPFRDATR